MSVHSSVLGDLLQIEIVGSFNIYQAENVKHTILQTIKSNKSIVLDLSKVDEFDTAGLQLLFVLNSELAKLGKNLQILHSAATKEVIDLLQLTNFK